MPRTTRREFLRDAALGAGSAALGVQAAGAQQERSITCFYQFGKNALEAFGGKEGLPNGDRYLHIFSHSHPGMRPHADTAQAVRALGPSFKYALAFDLNKYPGWLRAPDEQLQAWAKQFREHALVSEGPADYFAFNEMPTTGASTPHLREQATRLVRHLHEAGGGPKLRGVFYFTERNLNPAFWVGDSDDFWWTLEHTCDLVVGEHYHSYEFVMNKSVRQLSDHLDPLPKWLAASGQPTRQAIARRKYAVLHSSFYGPALRGWAGVESGKHDEASLEKYFRHTVLATRASQYGRRHISYGPLATQQMDARALPILARVLRQDLAA